MLAAIYKLHAHVHRTADVACLHLMGQHCTAVVQLRKVGRALARHNGQLESLPPCSWVSKVTNSGRNQNEAAQTLAGWLGHITQCACAAATVQRKASGPQPELVVIPSDPCLLRNDEYWWFLKCDRMNNELNCASFCQTYQTHCTVHSKDYPLRYFEE